MDALDDLPAMTPDRQQHRTSISFWREHVTAGCTCGWTGRKQTRSHEASEDAREHMDRVTAKES